MNASQPDLKGTPFFSSVAITEGAFQLLKKKKLFSQAAALYNASSLVVSLQMSETAINILLRKLAAVPCINLRDDLIIHVQMKERCHCGAIRGPSYVCLTTRSVCIWKDKGICLMA